MDPETAETENVGAESGEESEGISRGRKIRLAVLVGLLAALTAGLLGYRICRDQLSRQTEEAVSRHLREARRALAEDKPEEAAQNLQHIAELDPENPALHRLAVPLLHAFNNLEEAFRFFNQLEDFGQLSAEHKRYIRRTRAVWNLARRLTAGAQNDRERAMLLCRWFAWYTAPVDSLAVHTEPWAVLWSGSGNRQQLAWAYAELAGQAGVRCRIVTFSGENSPGPTVQVYPEEGQPFLVDPFRGIPLLDLQTGQLLAVQAAYGRLRSPPGQGNPEGDADEESAPEPALKTAVHPMALDPRMHAFDRLLADLPAHPRLSRRPGSPDLATAEELWRAPLRTAEGDLAAEAVRRSVQVAELTGAARQDQLFGRHSRAARAYEASLNRLTQQLAEADVQRGARVLTLAIEHLRFFAAANAHEAGRLEVADGKVRDYLRDYPDGRWRPAAKLLLAEIAREKGRHESARKLWRGLAPPRNTYGRLRAEGLLTWPDPAATPSKQEESPG